MAMQFGDAELHQAVDKCFKPAVTRTGFELRVVTDQQGAGLIDDQIRAALVSARFVVADLTHSNPGAYWEAGFADGRGLPVIYTCRRAEWHKAKTHFDTNHMVTVIWDPADLKPSEDQMVAIIRATLRAEAKQTDD
jgi:nucleoside 2-deoxyribosyltransferase